MPSSATDTSQPNTSHPPQSQDEQPRDQESETTPLLRRDPSTSEGQEEEKRRFRSKRWPSLLAMLLLFIAIILILVLGFVLPQIIEEYAMQALAVEPTSLSVVSFTPTGAIARVKADVSMDASRVRRKPVRDLGRFGTWIAREAETDFTTVKVSLPAYGDAILGTAQVPPIKINVRNGHTTPIDILTTIEPASKLEALKRIASAWIDGEIRELKLEGEADVAIRSGLISIGTQSILKSFVLRGNAIPSMPQYNITKVNFREMDHSEGASGLVADVGIKVANDYPFDFVVPPLGFSILVPACAQADPYIVLADAQTGSIHVKPKENIAVNVTGFVRRLPTTLITACPGSGQSPLDTILGEYIHGAATTIYVRGSSSPSADTPKWITEIMSGITVPVPFTGHSFGRLVRKFDLRDVKFNLPDPDAEPDTPEAQPKISARIKALVAVPSEMNFQIDVRRVRASAEILYQKQKLGFLELQQWRNATSSLSSNDTKLGPGLEVESYLERAPLTITNETVFSNVVGEILFKKHNVSLTVNAKVDVEVHTALGTFIVRQIPGSGVVPVKPISLGKAPSFMPKVYDLTIANTSINSVALNAKMNFTNPTPYSASVPYVDINILVNDTILGHATARNVLVLPGNNTGVAISAVWEPQAHGGVNGTAVGSELLSQYISGFNTSLTLRTHAGSIPSQPALGRVLSSLDFTFPTPQLGGRRPDSPNSPSGGDDDRPRFITSATMHIFSSTAQFTLNSPLTDTTLFVTSIDATAYHEGHPAGKIVYDGFLAVPPGESTSPKLPVEWSADSVGYKAVREALGGTLKLTTFAYIGLRIGEYSDDIWFQGRSIGAKVRL